MASIRRKNLVLVLPLALVLALFLIWPAAFGLVASLTDYAPAQPQTRFVGLDNYAAVVGDSEFGASVRNIALFTLITVPVELLIGFVLAYLLREPFRGRGLLRVILLLPWLVSPVANGVMWHFMFNSEKGIISFFLAWLGSPGFPSPLGIPLLALPASMLTDIWRKAPLVAFLLLPGMLGIPREDWEHAILEGASARARIQHIAWPRLRPLLLTIALLLAGEALGTFDSVLVMTGGGPGSRTMLPGLYSYKEAFSQHNWPLGATSAWLIVLAIALIGIVYVRLARGVRESSAHDGDRTIGGGVAPVEKPLGEVQGQSSAPERNRGSLIGWRWQRRVHGAGKALTLGMLVVLFSLPIVWTLLASFGIEPSNNVSPPAWSFAPSMVNYEDVGTTEPGFLQELWVSTALAATSTFLTILVAFLAAFALAQARFRGRDLAVQSFLILASLPVMAYAIPLGAITRFLHLYNRFLGVALAETAVFVPLAVYVLYGYVRETPAELLEAARLDGANVWQILRSIVAPVTAAGMAATGVIVFILSWNQFLVPLVLSTGDVRSIPMAMVDVFKWDRELEWPSVAAALVTSLLPLVILLLAAHRLLERFSLRIEHESFDA